MASGPSLVQAQVARIELHTFTSTTMTDEEALAGSALGTPVVLAGELRLPRPGTDRLPAVILLHGGGGIGGYVDDWVPRLNAQGVATFVLDSFTPRGLGSVTEDQARLGRLVAVVDAYKALALLSRHPRIDSGRIALMGFSRGGVATLYASVRRFQRRFGEPGTGFALFVPFYPDCTMRYLQDEDVVDAPIRVFHGGDDDMHPIAPCRVYLERLRKAGKDVALTEYPGARHVFDWQALRTPLRQPRAQTLRGCRVEEVPGGHLVNGATRQPFTYDDPCVERGATFAYDAQAQAAAVQAVARLVDGVLKAR